MGDHDKPDTYIQASKQPGKQNSYAWVRQDGVARPGPSRAFVTANEEDPLQERKTKKRAKQRHAVRSSLDESTRRPYQSNRNRQYHSEDEESSSMGETGYAIQWGEAHVAGKTRYSQSRRRDDESDGDMEVNVYPVPTKTRRRRSTTGGSKYRGSTAEEREDEYAGSYRNKNAQSFNQPRSRKSAQSVPHRRQKSMLDEESGHRAAEKRLGTGSSKGREDESSKGLGNYVKQGDKYLRQGENYIRTGEGLVRGMQGLFS